MKYLKAAVMFCLVTLTSNSNSQVTWIESTASGTWTERTATLSGLRNPTADVNILLEAEKQQIDGFGVCFNELGWTALAVLDDAGRETVLGKLFDTVVGLKLNICRMPIGANDYARNYYSLNDSADDFEMKYFSIDRDREMLLPYIKSAMKYRPDLGLGFSMDTSCVDENQQPLCLPAGCCK